MINLAAKYIDGILAARKYGNEVIHVKRNTLLSISRVDFCCSDFKSIDLFQETNEFSKLKSLSSIFY